MKMDDHVHFSGTKYEKGNSNKKGHHYPFPWPGSFFLRLMGGPGRCEIRLFFPVTV
jgi:hypothetical protein